MAGLRLQGALRREADGVTVIPGSAKDYYDADGSLAF